MFDPTARRRFGFGHHHRRWADAEPSPDWLFGRFGRRWQSCTEAVTAENRK